MQIITVMNYQDPNYIMMCKIWIYLAKKFNPEAIITIFYFEKNRQIFNFARNFSGITFHKLNNKGILRTIDTDGYSHPCQELKFAIWKYVERHHMNRFLYIEPDAFILGSLKTWWNTMTEKPYIAVAEKKDEGGLLFNTGPHSYCSKKNFITYAKLLGQYAFDGNFIQLVAGEQGLMNSFFRRIHYDWSHEIIGQEYNTLAKRCIIKTVSDQEISVFSGNYPKWIITIKSFLRIELTWWEQWVGWNNNKKAIILHAFGGKGFKFWELPECKKLWSYGILKCSEIEQNAINT
jgi:hypothetical protein